MSAGAGPSDFAGIFIRAVFLSVLLFAFPVAAATVKPTFLGPQLAKQPEHTATNEPVVLEAQEVEYDQQTNVVWASGNVEITQGKSVLLADSIIYDQNNDLVTAHGNISMLEASGNVYFADAMELKDEMRAGVIKEFRARLSDNSLFVAAAAQKPDALHTELFKAAYTPCKCDAEHPTPLWQIQADHALIDQDQQKIHYQNASFDAFGVPVFYTPYFSHPTPGADNQSGFLMPQYIHSDNLGWVLKAPYYYSIAPDKDLTFTPIFTSTEGPVMAGEYRQAFDAGLLDLDGSITRAHNFDDAGDPIPGRETRGYIDAHGLFNVGNQYDWGFDVRRSTDDTYLRRYGFSDDTLLTSRLYGEDFNFVPGNNRAYAVIQGLSFQGLTGLDKQSRIPVILPLVDVNYESNPGAWNSRFTFAGDAMDLYRTDGAKSRRLSATAGWKLPYISEGGQMIEFETQLRTDIYDVNDVALENGQNFSGITGREIPEASVTWHYPLIDRWAHSSLVIEPVVQAIVSPGGGNPEKIPNEDSLLPEFTDTNLFSSDRFAGLDRIENGPRISYGGRGQYEFGGHYLDFLFGQHYRAYNNPDFPLSEDLNSHFSDYVGKLGFASDHFNLAYRFRLNRDTLSPNRTEIDAGIIYPVVTLSGSYLSLKNDPILATKEIVTGSTTVNITQSWAWSVGATHDLLLDELTNINTGITYRNECFYVVGTVGRDYTTILDIQPSTTFMLSVFLKNLN